MYRYILILLFCLIYTGSYNYVFANRVTTYIVERQEERKSTRFTLTEWLRIKERMKMMDLWLAMFSEPKKDKFTPELSLYYGAIEGHSDRSELLLVNENEKGKLEKLTDKGTLTKANVWLTNLISASTGLRTLNIDLGWEGLSKSSVIKMPDGTYFDILGDQVFFSHHSTKESLKQHALNLRFFGKNLQDSFFTLKVGEYILQNSILKYWNGLTQDLRGNVAGGELALYFSGWLGLEGSYYSYMKGKKGTVSFEGTSLEYGAYIEISLFRFMAGLYQEDWDFAVDTQKLHETRSGTYLGAKVQF